MTNIKDVKNYAALQISRGYQKDSTRIEQTTASIFSVMHTLLIEFEQEEMHENAVYDYRTFARLIHEKKAFD